MKNNQWINTLVKYVCCILVLCLCPLSVAQFHHHGSYGDIHLSLLHSCDENTDLSHEHHHNHNSQPCKSDCEFTPIKAVFEEQIQKFTQFSIDSWALLSNHIEIKPFVVFLQQLYSPDISSFKQQYNSFITLRAPPFC